MKKAIVLSILGLAASGFAAFGQGVIAFNNYNATSYEPVYYNPSAALAPSGLAGANVNNTAVDLQIYYMLGNQTADSLATFLSTATPGNTTSITPGANASGTYFGNPAPTGAVGGPGGYFTATVQSITGWTVGTSVTFAIIAWDSTGGATYANSGLIGSSGVYLDDGSDIVASGGASPNINDNPAIMMSVPEPTTLAFAGMGMLSLLAFARRKKAKA